MAKKPKAMALLVGVDKFENDAQPPLPAVLNDVKDINDVMKSRNFATSKLLGKQATAKSILDALKAAAADLASGDMFVYYSASHGMRLSTPGGDEEHDDVFCAFDKDIVDDEFGKIWPTFNSGVRIVVITDTCSAGSAVRSIRLSPARRKSLEARLAKSSKRRRTKRISSIGIGIRGGVRAVGPRTSMRRAFAASSSGVEPGDEPVFADIKASLLHFAGCRDGESAEDTGENGLFTREFLAVMKDDTGLKSYANLFSKVHARVVLKNPDQHPVLTAYGTDMLLFSAQPPFEVNHDWPPLQFPT